MGEPLSLGWIVQAHAKVLLRIFPWHDARAVGVLMLFIDLSSEAFLLAVQSRSRLLDFLYIAGCEQILALIALNTSNNLYSLSRLD